MAVIDHVNIGVADLAASRAFYVRALAPLGYEPLMDRPYGVGFGRDGKPDFWISDRPSSAPLHVAFASPDRATVDAFHAAALAAGGQDNGAARAAAAVPPDLLRRVRARPRGQQRRGGLAPAGVSRYPRT